MARETAQDKRPQSRTRNGQSAQRSNPTTESARKSGADRQTPIQTSRDENRGGVDSSSAQPSRSGQQAQQGQQIQQGQQGAGVSRRGLTAPVRAGVNNPFAVMQRMAEDMDRLFEQFGFGRAGLGLDLRGARSLVPTSQIVLNHSEVCPRYGRRKSRLSSETIVWWSEPICLASTRMMSTSRSRMAC